MGVGGTFDIIITKVVTRAYTYSGVRLTSNTGNINITAKDDYDLLAIIVTLAGGGTVGVGVSILASVSF